ncbi:hypothetical protein ACFV5N_09955 [Streptomyces sp. NPDC059853]|uniref:hypothetical protein n=1 Tax=Streptomyces sp. NPDC059853 TaxID=3346973 RepID=UPI0036595A38
MERVRELWRGAGKRWIALGALLTLLAALQTGTGGTVSPARAVHLLPCEGLLPHTELRTLAGWPEVDAQRVALDPGRNRLACTLLRTGALRDTPRWLTVTASRRADDVEGGLLDAAGWGDALSGAALPEGLPGFLIQGSHGGGTRVALLLPCTDPDAPLLVTLRTSVSRGTDEDEPLVRAAVAAANIASSRLGCGHAPLPLPEDPVRRQVEGMPVAVLNGTSPCAVIVPDLPEDAPPGGWRVHEVVPDGGPYASCALPFHEGNSVLAVSGAYGPWAELAMAQSVGSDWTDGGRDPSAEPLSERWRPRADGRSATALTTCDGVFALFRAETVPGADNPVGEETLTAMVTAFATDQAERRGCEPPVTP